tara:strand:- start:2426 stop:2629 length:204 start_codon:yes stop_codon:yes gene_type:complete
VSEELRQAIETLCRTHGTAATRELVRRYIEDVGPEFERIVAAFPPANLIYAPFRPRPSGPITGERRD